MKAARFAFAFALLSLIALPSSAAFCGFCDQETSQCVPRTGLQLACAPQSCLEFFSFGCARAPQAGPELLAADYAVESVEIVTPAKADVSVEQPAPVAPHEVTK